MWSQTYRARVAQLPATLTLAEWTRTVMDFIGLCAYCGKVPADRLDHFVPVAHGGGTTAANCLPACDPCNGRKSSKLPAAVAALFGPGRIAQLESYLHTRSTGQNVEVVAPPAASPGMSPRPVKSRPKRTGPIGVHLNLPAELITAYDARVAELNSGGSGPQWTRTDLIRETLAAAAKAWGEEK